jgi:hypothetical protein
MKSRSLRRQKLWWCAEHNLAMREFQQMPVKYVLNHMPKFLQLFRGDYQRALDNLNQYLSSENADYWKTRQDYVQELCDALGISITTWNCSDLSQFKTSAATEYQAQGIFTKKYAQTKKTLLVDELRQLPVHDGAGIIRFDVESSSGMLAFRREARHPISRRLLGDDRVRICFHASTPGHGLLFLLDPTDHCQIIAPTIYQTDTQLRDGVLYVPGLHEDKFYAPEKMGCYRLYAITLAEPPTANLATTDGDRHLTDDDLRCLIDTCAEQIDNGSRLYRMDFLVVTDIKDYE